MIEQTDAILKEVLEPITFVLAYSTVSTTSDNTGTLLVNAHPTRCHYCRM